MSLLRVYSKMDNNHKIALPRGIRKALDIKPGDKLALRLRSVPMVSPSTGSGCLEGCRAKSRHVVEPLELTIIGMNKAKKLLVRKRRLIR